MKQFTLCLLALVCCAAHAEVNLAVISTSGAVDGGPWSASKAQKYAKPSPTDLVRVKSTNTAVQFGKVQATAEIEVCGDSLDDGTVSVWGSPCTKWTWIAAGTVARAAVISPAGKNYLDIEWTAPTQGCDGEPLPTGDLKGYRIAWGTANSLTNVIDVGLVTKYRLTGLPAGSISLTVASLGALNQTCGATGPVTMNTKAPSSESAPTGLKLSDEEVWAKCRMPAP